MNENGYKRYLLAMLLLVYAFNTVDRAALGLVLQDIKLDLKLSDTQLGFLTGIAFALFYSIMGIPIARWADRGNRVTIISLTCAVWSAMVALCGVAGSFTQLLLIRVGVAVGEAGGFPPANSLIADNFTRPERPRAVATYMMGAPLSVVIGYFGAGWLNEFYGWRMTFMLLGLPGLVLAIVVWFTLKEPRREAKAISAPPPEADSLKEPSLREVCVTLWANKTFLHLLLAYSVMCFFGYGIWQWGAAFFIRSHGLRTGEIGTWFAGIWGACGILGTYWGGMLASRYASNNERLQLRVMAIVFAGFGVVSAFIFLARNHLVSFGLMALAAVAWRTTDGPLFATIQTLVPSRMRAMAVAIVLLSANLIGMGLGPLAAGALSDALRPVLGDESLRGALVALCPGSLWAGWHVWRASRSVASDLSSSQSALTVVS